MVAAPEVAPSEAASPADDQILGTEDGGWAVTAVRFLFSYYTQEGRGFQSKATGGVRGGPGSEEIVVIQPMAQVDIRQSDTTSHSIFFPVDLITAASPEAVDVVSSASKVNEAATLDITSNYRPNDEWQVTFRYGVHWEEPMTSFIGGVGLARSLAEDNAVLSLNVGAIADLFKLYDPFGSRKEGFISRAAYSANASLSQILSETTIAAITYGATYQKGVLEQTWNSLAITDGKERIAERLPGERLRHAMGARIAQHVPWTHSTVKASYRFYIDDFDLSAHTLEFEAYQYLTPNIYLRGEYRFHTQSAVAFFHTSVPEDFDPTRPRTADSDLASFDAHEYGLRLVWLLNPRGSAQTGSEYFGVSFLRYERSNDLSLNMFSLSYGATP